MPSASSIDDRGPGRAGHKCPADPALGKRRPRPTGWEPDPQSARLLPRTRLPNPFCAAIARFLRFVPDDFPTWLGRAAFLPAFVPGWVEVVGVDAVASDNAVAPMSAPFELTDEADTEPVLPASAR